MRKAVTKSLYLFLCSILGMILFAMLHRALFVIYGILLEVDFTTYSLGLTESAILMIDFLSMLIALFFGGWYGVLLGIDWYSIVYGPSAPQPAKLFHGFVPANFRNRPKKTVKTESRPSLSSTTIKIPGVDKVSAILNTPIETPEVFQPTVQKVREWTFDDLIKKPEPVKPTPARKIVRKSATKTATKTVSTKTVAKKTVARKSVRKAPVQTEV